MDKTEHIKDKAKTRKTINVSKELYKRLYMMKVESEYKSLEEVIEALLR